MGSLMSIFFLEVRIFYWPYLNGHDHYLTDPYLFFSLPFFYPLISRINAMLIAGPFSMSLPCASRYIIGLLIMVGILLLIFEES